MLCLKSEQSLDEQHNARRRTTTAFVFPSLNLGSSLNKYLTKNPRVSTRSFSSADASSISSYLEEPKLHIDKGRLEGGENKHHHRYQLEEEVKKLEKQLQVETDLRLALANALEPAAADLSLTNSASQLPVKVRELLDSIAVLQIMVSKLEQESIALHFQLSQERNEHRLTEYRLRRLPSSGSSEFDCSLACLTEPANRLLVEQLANINPSRMSCNEKLAFWINLYNALIMHAYLAYGVPGSDIKLFSLMQKAAYTVGRHSVSAADIEYITLKMKPPAHRPQIALVVALQKFKVSDEQNKYSIDHPEPLLPFTLSYGMHSSPAVRVFRPDYVNELLKKFERLRASISWYKPESKIVGTQVVTLFRKRQHRGLGVA